MNPFICMQKLLNNQSLYMQLSLHF